MGELRLPFLFYFLGTGKKGVRVFRKKKSHQFSIKSYSSISLCKIRFIVYCIHVKQIGEKIMSHTIFTGGAVDKLEEVLKALVARVEELENSVEELEASLAETDGTIQNLEDDLEHRVSVLEDSVTTIEECKISEWNTPAKEEKEYMRDFLNKDKEE